MKNRFIVFFACLGVLTSSAAMAATPAAAPAWHLKTETNPVNAEQTHCTIRAETQKGPLIIARNMIGQFSIQVPFAGASAGPQPVQVAAGALAARTITARVKKDGTMNIPLGWDDALLSALASANRLSVTAADKKNVFALSQTGLGLSQLVSCNASLLERNPNADGLPRDVRAVVAKAGMQELRLVQNAGGGDRGKLWAWVFDGVFGGMDELTVKPDATLDQVMLDYVDRLEPQCQGRFISDVGIPSNDANARQIADATLECVGASTTTLSTLVFAQSGTRVQVFFTETDPSRRAKATRQQNALMDALR